MRRIIAIVLLIASIPLQFAWAEVHSFCEHDDGPYALHIGYHDHGDGQDHGHTHSHSGDATNLDSSDLAGINADHPPGGHTDCNLCHAGSMAALFDVFSLLTFDLDKRQQIYLSFSERAAPFARPERPQWTSLA